MRRIALIAALAALVSLAAAALAADAAKRSQCQRLKGKDLAPARSVKLVRVPNPDWNGNDLVGCMLPRGDLYKIASSSDRETAGESYSISQVNGRVVLVAHRFGSQYGSGESAAVWDLRSGSRYTIGSYDTESELSPSGFEVPAAFVTKAGRAAAAIVSRANGVTWIAGFAADGKRRDFDVGAGTDLDGYSLGLRGNLVSWKHGGTTRTADLKTAG